MSVQGFDLRSLARLVGVRADDVEDALASRAHARAVLSRRGLFQAAAALAATKTFGFVEVTEREALKEYLVAAAVSAPGGQVPFWDIILRPH